MNILTALILSLTMSLGAGVKCSDAEMYFCDGFFGASLIETKIETVVYNSKDESEIGRASCRERVFCWV